MVAERVDVLTRKAGEEQAWLWSSDGKGAFTIEEAARDGRGTTVTLHLADDADEFLEESRIRQIVKTYSDHIGFPIVLGEGDDGADPERRLVAVDAAEEGHHRRAVQGVLPPRRPRLRRSLADHSQHRRGRRLVHQPAVRADDGAVRPVRSAAQGPGEALRQAGVHHRRLRRPAAALSALSCAASSTPRTCRSTSAARPSSMTRAWRRSAPGWSSGCWTSWRRRPTRRPTSTRRSGTPSARC